MKKCDINRQNATAHISPHSHIVQIGDPVLRKPARNVIKDKIDTPLIQSTIRVFICFCCSHFDSQCEPQKLNPRGNINYQSHLSRNIFKALDSLKV